MGTIQLALDRVRGVLMNRGLRYGNTVDEFAVQREQAELAGSSIRDTFRQSCAQKLARERNLADLGKDTDENYIDSILDLAGYATLWLAYELGTLPIEAVVSTPDHWTPEQKEKFYETFQALQEERENWRREGPVA